MFVLFILSQWLFAEPDTSALGWSDAQVVQEHLPVLQGQILSLTAQVESKKKYFNGEAPLDEAFWHFDVEDLFSYTSLEGLRLSLLAQNEQRLSERYTFPVFETHDGSVAKEYKEEMDRLWLLQAELDALNLRFLNLILQEMKAHPQIEALFIEATNTCKNKLEALVGDPTNKAEIALVMQELTRLKQLKILIVSDWTTGTTQLQSHADSLLAEHNGGVVSSRGLYFRYKILVDLMKDTPTHQQVIQKIVEFEDAKQKEKELQQQEAFENLKQQWPNKVSEFDLSAVEEEKAQLMLQRDVSGLSAIETETIEFKLGVLRERESELKGIAVEQDLIVAQRQLEQAREKQSTDAMLQKVNEEVLRLLEIETQLRADESNRHQKVQKSIEEFQIQFAEWTQRYEDWETLPPLDASRKSTLNELQVVLHKLQWDMQEYIVNFETLSPSQIVDSEMTHVDIESALKSIEDANQDSIRHRQAEKITLLDTWVSINQYTHRVGYLDVETDQFWSDVIFEWTQMVTILEMQWLRVQRSVGDVGLLFRLTSSVFKWSIVLGIWFWTRRKFPLLWNGVYAWMNSVERPEFLNEFSIGNGDTQVPKQLSENISVLLYNFASAFVLTLLFQGSLGVVVALLFLLVSSLYLSQWLVKYWAVDDAVQTPLLNGVKGFVWVVIGLNLVGALLKYGVYAYQTVEVVSMFQLGLFGLLVLTQLGVWSDLLQQKASQTIGLDKLKMWMQSMSSNWLGSRLRTVLASCILIWDAIIRLLFWLVEHSSFFGTVLARNAIDNTGSQDVGLVSKSFQNVSWTVNWTPILRPFVEQIHDTIVETQAKGSIVLLADEGMGKSGVLEMVLANRTENSRLLQVNHIVRDENWTVEAMLFWLCEQLNLSNTTNLQGEHAVEEVCRAILDMPQTIIGVDDIQRVFLRDVKGFEVLSQLLSIIQATSTHHCWVVTCHSATWNFWNSPSTSIRVDFFTAVYTMHPLDVSTMRDTIVDMLETNGVEVDFSTLSSLDNVQAVHRAQMAFWRLLRDSSKGNLSTAIELFKTTLKESTESKQLSVQMFSLQYAEELANLDDGSNFVLACVLMHNRCTLTELIQSLQMSAQELVVVCRNLESKRILKQVDHRFQIDLIWYPWVEANLWQKRFVGQKG